MQGLVVVFDVVRMTWTDDDVGGAVQTGTVVGESIQGMLNVLAPTRIALEQGLETPRIADVLLRPRAGALTILESDQLQIVGPTGQPNLNEFWRVESVQEPTGMHPKNRKRFLRLRITRVDRTRTNALQ